RPGRESDQTTDLTDRGGFLRISALIRRIHINPRENPWLTTPLKLKPLTRMGGTYVHAYHVTFRYRHPARSFVHARSDQAGSAGSIAAERSLCRARMGDFHFGLDRRRQGAILESAWRAERVALVRLPKLRPMQQSGQLQSDFGAGADGDAGHIFL